MGCSDRYDLDYCEFKLTNASTGTRYNCNNRTSGGIYCSKHTKNVLPKEDAAEVIAKLQEKQKQAVQKWLTKSA